jgi:hypothetical protein
MTVRKQLRVGLIAFAFAFLGFIFPPILLALPVWAISKGISSYRERHRPPTADEARAAQLAGRAQWLKESGLG